MIYSDVSVNNSFNPCNSIVEIVKRNVVMVKRLYFSSWTLIFISIKLRNTKTFSRSAKNRNDIFHLLFCVLQRTWHDDNMLRQSKYFQIATPPDFVLYLKCAQYTSQKYSLYRVRGFFFWKYSLVYKLNVSCQIPDFHFEKNLEFGLIVKFYIYFDDKQISYICVAILRLYYYLLLSLIF